jgi:hypothetical protein
MGKKAKAKVNHVELPGTWFVDAIPHASAYNHAYPHRTVPAPPTPQRPA